VNGAGKGRFCFDARGSNQYTFKKSDSVFPEIAIVLPLEDCAMETKMHAASLTFTMVLGLSLLAAGLWHFSETETPQNIQVDHTHAHVPSHSGDLWVVISSGFR
jgi:hypothetical protein